MKTVNQILLTACQPNTTRADYDRIVGELISAGMTVWPGRTGLCDRIIGAAIQCNQPPVAGVVGEASTGIDRAMDVACALDKAFSRRK